ncbi:MAG: RNA-binding protein [Xanthobacteraceae bacterium]
MQIATGEATDEKAEGNIKLIERARKGGLKGGKARATKLSGAKRKAIARRAAKARWERSS